MFQFWLSTQNEIDYIKNAERKHVRLTHAPAEPVFNLEAQEKNNWFSNFFLFCRLVCETMKMVFESTAAVISICYNLRFRGKMKNF